MQKIIGAKKIGSRELEFFGTSLELNVGDKVVVDAVNLISSSTPRFVWTND